MLTFTKRKRKKKVPGVSTDPNLPNNYKVARMAKHGASTYVISRTTGYTPAQVQHRIGMYGLTWCRGDFRDYNTPESQPVLKAALTYTDAVKQIDVELYEKVRVKIMRARFKAMHRVVPRR